ncbi:DUF4065 domain-containing protein [bacterium]|nr:MAG: DUF4065 domain-containing protein [bacterium]
MHTPQELGHKISVIRKQKQLSQEELARILGISRTAVTQIESGKRNLSALELFTLSQALAFSLDMFVSTSPIDKNALKEVVLPQEELRVSVPEMNLNKFKQVLLYVLEKCAGKPNVGETVLYKLLYFADFNYYEIYETHLSGAQYKKLPFGPVPHQTDFILSQLAENGEIQRIKVEYHGFPQTRFIPLVRPDLTQLTAAETEILDQTIERFADWSAKAISDYSHKDLPWKATRDGDWIDYELAFYREAPFSARIYDEEPEER